MSKRARRRLPEPRDQRRQSALAAAGGTHDGQSRAGRDVQVDVVQDRRAGRAGHCRCRSAASRALVG